jgi:UDP-N-acetylmuramoyl-L-alanyl-D-glutamate--2,6-diaminopimelate ligase
MSAAVARYADVVWMTSDNPRSEDPEIILDHMEEGMRSFLGKSYRLADRADAIHRAIAGADPGDTVLVAGKGHETYQILRDSVMPFDDRIVAREALAARGGSR